MNFFINYVDKFHIAYLHSKYEQEDHGPRLAHLSEIVSTDMQMLYNIFPILSLQLMKGSYFEQFLVLKKKNVFFFFIIFFLPYMGMTVNWAWPYEQTPHPVSGVGSTWNLVEIGQVVSGELFNNIMILCMYPAQGQGKITLAE